MHRTILDTGALALILSLAKSIPEAAALGLAVSLSSTALVLPCLPRSPHSASHPHDVHSNSKGDKQSHRGSSTADSSSLTSAKAALHSFESHRARKTMLGFLLFQDVMIGHIIGLLPTLQGTLT